MVLRAELCAVFVSVRIARARVGRNADIVLQVVVYATLDILPIVTLLLDLVVWRTDILLCACQQEPCIQDAAIRI